MVTRDSQILPVDETVRRTIIDRNLLMDRVGICTEEELIAPYLVQGGPLGDFCESLRDLVAHVLMWDEISLSVLTEARHGRAHWSLAERWEDPEVGKLLNISGIAAGRELPVELLVDRFTVVRDGLLDELSRYDDEQWGAPIGTGQPRTKSIGALAQHVMTIPRNEPYWHAAVHLGDLAAVRS